MNLFPQPNEARPERKPGRCNDYSRETRAEQRCRSARLLRHLEADAHVLPDQGAARWADDLGLVGWPPTLRIAAYGAGTSVAAPLAALHRWRRDDHAPPCPWDGVELHHVDPTGRPRSDGGGRTSRRYGRGRIVHLLPGAGETLHLVASLASALAHWTRGELALAACGSVAHQIEARALAHWATRNSVARVVVEPARNEDSEPLAARLREFSLSAETRPAR